MKVYELTATRIPHPPVPFGQGVKSKEVRTGAEGGKKGKVGEDVFSFILIS